MGTSDLVLDLDGEGPLYSQLYRALRDAILAGRLAAGSRLPGSRSLGALHGLSRNTALEAVSQLVDEGYAHSRQGSGTYVRTPTQSDVVALPDIRKQDSASFSSKPRALSTAATRALEVAAPGSTNWDLRRSPVTFDFRYGEPSYRDFPFELWSRLTGRRLRSATIDDLAYRRPGGHPALREALSEYLVRARGARCRPEQIVVVYGSQQAVDLVARLLINPGDDVVLENPHYPGFRFVLEAYGACLLPIPVDEYGLDTGQLPNKPNIKLACVTPSHQYPTGAVLPAERRLALLDWATLNHVTILEDDYDSEYRFTGRPLPCLQGLDRAGRVIYAGTFSKVLFPSLRIGYVILPDDLIEPFLRLKALTDTGTASTEQSVLAEFLREGHFESHLRRTRRLNAARREALVEALNRQFGDEVRVGGDNAGLHVMVELTAGASDENGNPVDRLRRAALREGVRIYPIDQCYVNADPPAAFLMGYSSMEPEQIRDGVARLAVAARSLRATGKKPRA